MIYRTFKELILFRVTYKTLYKMFSNTVNYIKVAPLDNEICEPTT